MSKAIDFARAHFSAKARITVEVPEWPVEGGGPLVVHASPLTLAEKQRIDKYRETWGKMEALAYTLIIKAEDAEGKKLFSLDDKRSLMTQVDPDVLARVVLDIVAPVTPEDLQKN